MKTPLNNLNLEIKEQLTHYKDKHVRIQTLPNQLKIGTLDTNSKLGFFNIPFKQKETSPLSSKLDQDTNQTKREDTL
jgi:hypothetical protein